MTQLIDAKRHGRPIGALEPEYSNVITCIVVKSARGAVPVFRPARFPRPLPEPAVRLSTQRALHKSRGSLRDGSHPMAVVGQGVGMTVPRYR